MVGGERDFFWVSMATVGFNNGNGFGFRSLGLAMLGLCFNGHGVSVATVGFNDDNGFGFRWLWWVYVLVALGSHSYLCGLPCRSRFGLDVGWICGFC